MMMTSSSSSKTVTDSLDDSNDMTINKTPTLENDIEYSTASSSSSSLSELTAFALDSTPYSIPINGYVMPFFAIATIVTNSLVVAVLLRRHLRTPTNALLVSLAASDTLTCLCPLPVWVRFYTMSAIYSVSRSPSLPAVAYLTDWVPYRWCFVYYILTDYLPTIFHSVSIWLTVSLAVQRYLRVCRPPDSPARRFVCSMSGTLWIVAGIFVVAAMVQLFRLAEMTYVPVELPSKLTETLNAYSAVETNANYTTVPGEVFDENITGCHVELSHFVVNHEIIYFNIYYWSRVTVVHVVPCIALVALNARLVKTMLDSARRRRALRTRPPIADLPSATVAASTAFPVDQPKATEAFKQSEDCRASLIEQHQLQTVQSPVAAAETSTLIADPPSTMVVCGVTRCRPRMVGHAGHGSGSTRATAMLMTVVAVFLVVEIPMSVIFVLVIVENTVGIDLYGDDTRDTAELLANLFIVVSYPVNFFIYCSMSREFRHTFSSMFSTSPCRRLRLLRCC